MQTCTVTHPDRNQPVFERKTKTEKSTRTLALVPQIIKYLNVGEPEAFVPGGEKALSYQQIRKMRERIQKDIGFEEAITPRRFRTTVLTDIYDQRKDSVCYGDVDIHDFAPSSCGGANPVVEWICSPVH